MSDENELDTSAGSFSSRSSPRSFDMWGGASSLPSLSLPSSGAPCLLVRSACRPALLASCLSCGRFPLFLRRACLLSVPPVLPYRRIALLPARSTREAGRWRFASRSGFASVVVACCLSWRGRGCCGAVPLVCLALCRRVDGVGWLRDFRRSRCLPLAPFYRVGVVLLCRPLVLACLPSSSLVACGSWRSRCRLRSCLASSPLLASPRRRRVVVMG